MTARSRWLVILGVVSLIQVGWIAGTSWPLGVPGEWTWSRTPAGQLDPIGLGLLLIVGGGYLVFVWRGSRELEGQSRGRVWIWLLALWFCSSALFWTTRGISSGIYGQSGLTWVTYYPRMSGYFTQASQPDITLRRMLTEYEQTVRDGDYLHQGTHPPGLPVWFRLAREACESFPGLTALLLATESPAVAAGTDVLAELALSSGASFTPIDRAVLWGNLLLTVLLTMAVVFPLFGCLTGIVGRVQAWWLCALWPCCPGLVVFVPKSDLLLAFFAIALLFGWTRAVAATGPARQFGAGLLTGLLAWLALMISLASLVVLVILGLWTCLLAGLRADPATDETEASGLNRVYQLVWNPRCFQAVPWGGGAGLLAGIAIPSVLLWWQFDLNLWTVWTLNLAKHAEFYDHNPRTMWAWLLVNPWELAASLGAPAALLTVVSVRQLLTQRRWTGSELLALAVVCVWGLLWLSGKNMGEAARLWLFFTPLLIYVAGAGQRPAGSSASAPAPPAASLTDILPYVLIAQMIVCAVTVASIDGFDYAALIP